MFGMICYGKKIFVETITMVNEQREKKQKQMIDIVYVASRDRHWPVDCVTLRWNLSHDQDKFVFSQLEQNEFKRHSLVELFRHE